MKVLILGGTGNISTEIVQRLIMQGAEVTLFNRGLRPVRYKGDVTVLQGDRADREGFEAIMKNLSFDAVIDMIAYTAEDAASTLRALSGRTGHFVFTSSVAAYKRPMRSFPIREDAELYDTPVFQYGYEKARMERFLLEKIAEGIPITIIRPSLTYGIGCKNIGIMRNNYGIVQRIKQGKSIIVFGDGTNPWAWTYAPDIAKAYTGVLGRKACMGKAYHATSDDMHIWDDLYYAFGRVLGIEPKLRHIATEMLMQAAPKIFEHVYNEKMYAGIYDNTAIKADVPEFVCTYTLDMIIEDITRWYESDEKARFVDPELDALEDTLISRYEEALKIMKRSDYL